MTQCLQESKQMEKVMEIETDIDWYEKEDETKQREWCEETEQKQSNGACKGYKDGSGKLKCGNGQG